MQLAVRMIALALLATVAPERAAAAETVVVAGRAEVPGRAIPADAGTEGATAGGQVIQALPPAVIGGVVLAPLDLPAADSATTEGVSPTTTPGPVAGSGAPAVATRLSRKPVTSPAPAIAVPAAGTSPAPTGETQAQSPAATPASAPPLGPPLPLPSIVTGEVAVLMASSRSQALPVPGLVPRAARDRIREIDQRLFMTLLAGGVFDPAPGDVAAGVQAELAALGCYDGRIDGQWGGRSQAALAGFLGQSGAPVAEGAPGPQTFRQLAASAGRCPQTATRSAVRAGDTTDRLGTPAGTARTAPRGTAPAATGGANVRSRAAQTGPQSGASRRAAGNGAAATSRTAPTPGRTAPATTATPDRPRIDPNLIGSGVFR